MTLEQLREKSSKLPMDPGVYIMKDKTQKVIYVGKALHLRNRVHQYFLNITAHTPKVYQMVTHVNDFDFIVVGSEFEALILECNLIKQYKPKYNILLKDDKGYHYIRITGGDYPNMEEAKKKEEGDNCRYIGPYISGYSVKQAVQTAKKLFGLPTCKKQFPRDFGKERPCLNYHIGQCCGLCTGKISKAEYAERVKGAEEYLLKGEEHLLAQMEAQMMGCAERCEFEKAAQLRDRIAGLKKVQQRQQVVFENKVDMDAVAIAKGEGLICAVVLCFRDGRLSDKQEFLLQDDLAADDLLEEFIASYYSAAASVPREVLCQIMPSNAPLLQQLLEQKRGTRVSILVPQRGEKVQLVQKCYSNAVEGIAYRRSRQSRTIAALDELAKLLGMKKVPDYIESYDISNLGDSYKVCGMVVFEQGAPKKAAYKRFQIKTVAGQDDYACMREALQRRLTRLKQGDSDPGFAKKPDLILLDGGEGHVSVVRELMHQMQIDDIPVFGLVKDSKHRTRAVAMGGREVALSGYKSAFALCTRIQDEVHRYAISYQRSLQRNTELRSSLTDIPGVGPVTAKKLLRAFRTMQDIELAGVADLMEKAGVSQRCAKSIFRYFHK